LLAFSRRRGAERVAACRPTFERRTIREIENDWFTDYIMRSFAFKLPSPGPTPDFNLPIFGFGFNISILFKCPSLNNIFQAGVTHKKA
jgi:hypothetical protein